jgi:hypothetical protein
MRSFRAWSGDLWSVRVLLGALLLAAAALKAHALATDTAQPMPLMTSLRAQVMVIEVEGLLGLWLLTGLYPGAARWVALTFFTTLAGVSLYLGLSGESSCGCLGRLKVNPWLTFAADLTAVVALAWWRVPRGSERDSVRWVRGGAKILAGAAAFLLLMMGGLLVGFDDPWSALARLRGEAIRVEPAVSEVGVGVPGEEREFTVALVNSTGHTVRVIGGTSSCSCAATGDLPITLAPGETRPVRVTIGFRGGKGMFQARFLFYTDDEKQSEVVARLAGRVAEPAQ